MNLIEYEGKKVRITDIDNQVFEGIVSDYVYPDDDDTGLESIIVDCTAGPLSGKPVEFWKKDIKEILIINE